MKKSTMKKLLVAMLSFAMIFAMAACGGGSSDSGDAASSADGGFTIFNSKMEIQDQSRRWLSSTQRRQVSL